MAFTNKSYYCRLRQTRTRYYIFLFEVDIMPFRAIVRHPCSSTVCVTNSCTLFGCLYRGLNNDETSSLLIIPISYDAEATRLYLCGSKMKQLIPIFTRILERYKMSNTFIILPELVRSENMHQIASCNRDGVVKHCSL